MTTLSLPDAPFTSTVAVTIRALAGRRRSVASSPTATTSSRRKRATLAVAIDEYKLVHRRRFITYEEMLCVVKSLGYHK